MVQTSGTFPQLSDGTRKTIARPVSRSKAREMLRDGTVRGHKLTDKQRGLFGAIAGGAKPRGKR